MTLHAIDRWAEQAFRRAAASLRHGRLVLELPSGTCTVGHAAGPSASLRVHHPRFFRRALLGGEIGFGESYLDADWSTPDLVALLRLMLANLESMPSWPGLTAAARLREAVAGRLGRNTRARSRHNVCAHYDLGNEFFKLFLDANLLYSCALFERSDDTLEVAQINKLRAICDALDLTPRDHVLEIGTGWGGFAVFAATRYGCRVTTTTISREQHAYAERLIAQSGVGARITLRAEDYRDLRGRFDKIVSIEMFEAVGLRHYDDFFGACDRLLAPDGALFLQTITVDDWRFHDYRRTPTWIGRHIFPGAELASVAEILASLARVTRLRLHEVRQIGAHYARTIHHWRARFHTRLNDVRALGFNDRFLRMWDVYLSFCEAAFLDEHIGDVQLLLAKPGYRGASPPEVPDRRSRPGEPDSRNLPARREGLEPAGTSRSSSTSSIRC